MIAATTFNGVRVALFGLGGSGAATLDSLVAGGAEVIIGDDNDEAVARHRGKAAGVLTADTDLAGFHALVLAPGVPLTHPEPHWSAKLASAARVPVIGDLEILARERAARAPASPLVCITGTNGKSTTTALVAHLLRQAGRKVAMGGNIGTPALALAPPSDDLIHVIECSSYQIDLAPSLAPTHSIHLNLSPDHLDRHGTFENYAAIKERLTARAGLAVVGVDDAASAAIAERHMGGLIRVSGYGADADVGLNGARIVARDWSADLSNAASLRGAHNAQNAAAAVAVAYDLGLSETEIQAGLNSFPGLAHRMQIVGETGGVMYVNDSKATNADAAQHALRSFDAVRWIVGGVAKAEGIEPLAPLFSHVVKAYIIGEAANDFARTLGETPHEIAGTMEAAVAAASAEARPGEVVLLSPACASFDQFKNFEQRGQAFADLVRQTIDRTPGAST